MTGSDAGGAVYFFAIGLMILIFFAYSFHRYKKLKSGQVVLKQNILLAIILLIMGLFLTLLALSFVGNIIESLRSSLGNVLVALMFFLMFALGAMGFFYIAYENIQGYISKK